MISVINTSMTGCRANGIRPCHIPIVGLLDSPLDEDEVKRVRCTLCTSRFRSKAELDVHSITHGETEVIMCSLCEKTYLKYPQFKRHFVKHHPELESINKIKMTETLCDIKDTASADEILRYMRMTTIEGLLNTDVRTDLHMEGIKAETYLQVCGLCGALVLSPEELELHNLAVHPDFENRCQLCTMLFIDKAALKKHLTDCSIGSLKHECLLCGHRFHRKGSFAAHVSKVHGTTVGKWARAKRPGSYVCERCGKCYSSRDRLKPHLEACMPQQTVECDYCRKQFKTKLYLERHLKLMHNPGGKVYSHLCSACGKTFVNKTQLNNHMFVHTGDSPYKCNVCHKSFGTPHGFKYHKRTHTGDTPLKCNQCGKSFIRPVSLRNHMMIHTGERPHRCAHCHAVFIQSFSLAVHVKRHHSLKIGLPLNPEPFKEMSASNESIEEEVPQTEPEANVVAPRRTGRVCATTARRKKDSEGKSLPRNEIYELN